MQVCEASQIEANLPSVIDLKPIMLCGLTYELHGSVQPGQDLLTEAVVDRNTQEVGLGDEVRLGAGVTGI